MKKKLTVLTLCVLALLALAACGSGAKEEQNSEKNELSDSYRVIKNLEGKDISVPAEISRVVSMTPTFTEVIVALDHQNQLVAVDTYSNYIENLPEDVQYFDMMAPDVEQLIALNPDLVLVSTMSTKNGNDYYSQLEDEGITVLYIPSSDSIEGIYKDLAFMARVFGEEEKGQAMVEDMKKEFAAIEEKGKTISDKKKVYFEIAAAPNLYTFGRGVFLDEIIQVIGAENIIDDKEGWTSISEEAIISKNPDVIITNVDYVENATEEIKSRQGWENINAVKNNEVYYVDNMSSSHSNHTIIKALHQMASAIYPDVYEYED